MTVIEKRRDAAGWRRIALPASIVLNLFLAAVIGGHLWHNRHAEPAVGGPFARALANAAARLPPQDAATFTAVMKRDAPHYAEAAQQLAAARQALVREIIAEPFDPAGLQQALAAWRTAQNRFLDDFSGSFLDAVGQLSPEGRRKLIPERLQQRAAPDAR